MVKRRQITNNTTTGTMMGYAEIKTRIADLLKERSELASIGERHAYLTGKIHGLEEVLESE